MKDICWLLNVIRNSELFHCPTLHYTVTTVFHGVTKIDKRDFPPRSSRLFLAIRIDLSLPENLFRFGKFPEYPFILYRS
jgi:hypothetical protein